eukprot:TRINITY_DN3964_c0_g1_i1.p1 TRINITY_DN3964_c0_g1~~TRINITY_DN3964_c0_g1_i1.p1  ORF type:complete len:525 (+),score=54.21 TRINITY_DN3964_c0_g1_i1:74-1576(+)
MSPPAERHDAQATGRLVEASGSDLRALGCTLATRYRARMENGVARAKDYYSDLKPITCDLERWKTLSELARAGAQRCCPAATAFFAGLDSQVTWDVYDGLLDFEVYQLELQRQARDRQRRAAQRARTDDTSNDSPRSNKSSSSSSSSASSEINSDAGAAILEAAKRDAAASQLSNESAKEEDRAKIDPLGSGRCTGFALVSGGHTAVVAQSADLPPILYGYGDYDCVLRLSTPGGSVVVYDSDGRLCPVGFNSSGLGVGIFNLHQSQTVGYDQPSLTCQTIAWELLLGQHTRASAIDWLRSLPVPTMCGSALLLADATGAVCVEFGAGCPVAITSPLENTPVARANHALHASRAETFGDTEKARRDSERRQRAVEESLSKRTKGSDYPPIDGAAALSVLREAKKVRNLSTLACIAADLQRMELHVEFKDRQPTGEIDIARMAVEVGLSPQQVSQALVAGAVNGNTGRERIISGLPVSHVHCWVPHVFALAKSVPDDDMGS